MIAAAARLDVESVSAVVMRFALRLGCSDSNATASVAWALRTASDTLGAVRAGKLRAQQLRDRQFRSEISKPLDCA